MSWHITEYIGELRPWPDSVHVVRGRTGETVRYFPERTCRMEPDGYCGEQYGIYKCSNCGELWQFEQGGPPRTTGSHAPAVGRESRKNEHH